MSSSSEDVYATLLLNDIYLPGALVLAHSLRDAGTTKKLAVLVTTDSISTEGKKELWNVYDYVIPVERISNNSPENLYLMNRPDLHSTFTKITLWKQLQFRKIVYIDSDMVALRAPDELFDLPYAFSAAPDIGWPDIFNSGLMVLSPNIDEYNILLEMAQNGTSFDGADQGLLNMHFSDSYNRLSFTYNVTPSAHYQYLPAYRHFRPNISMAHFIGHHKPWFRRSHLDENPSPHAEMVEKWWEVHDRHYETLATKAECQLDKTNPTNDVQEVSQYEVARRTGSEKSVSESHRQDVGREAFEINPHSSEGNSFPTPEHIHHMHPEHTNHLNKEQKLEKTSHERYGEFTEKFEQESEVAREKYPHIEESDGKSAPRALSPIPVTKTNWEENHISAWDASKEPPPVVSRPEASNFPVVQYTMSSDPTPYKAPERYPDPPTDMWYEVPKTPTNQKLSPIFPWEFDVQKPSRVFPEDYEETFTLPLDQNTQSQSTEECQDITTTPEPLHNPVFANTWQSFTMTNAWDDIPEIERYVGRINENRKKKLHGSGSHRQGPVLVSGLFLKNRTSRLTEPPLEADRPSHPVTPALGKKPKFWEEKDYEQNLLPSAEGVPPQEEWDPTKQLDQLVLQHAQLFSRESREDATPGHAIPSRELPCGSESVSTILANKH